MRKTLSNFDLSSFSNVRNKCIFSNLKKHGYSQTFQMFLEWGVWLNPKKFCFFKRKTVLYFNYCSQSQTDETVVQIIYSLGFINRLNLYRFIILQNVCYLKLLPHQRIWTILQLLSSRNIMYRCFLNKTFSSYSWK